MIKKSIRSIFWFFLLSVSLLQVGAIRKNEDAIVKTQTDPISLKKKQEEIKDGVKGAPTPSFEFYKKEGFLTRDPMAVAKEGQEAPSEPREDVTEVTWEEDGEIWETESAAEAEEETPAEEGDEEEWWIEDAPQEVPPK